MRKFRIITLGCKVNRAESEGIAQQLAGPEWQPADGSEPVDVCVVNTCAVTRKAAMQSRQAVRQAIHADSRTCVVVTGCYAQTDPQALKRIEGVDCVLDQRAKPQLPEIIRRGALAKGHGAQAASDAASACAGPEAWLPAAAVNRTRPFLKIQDGCESFCTYCIVPYARGKSRSMPLPMVVERVDGLAASGFREVVVTGIHLGQYGRDLDPPQSLFELLATLERAAIPIRVRLSSIEPLELTAEILDLVSRSRSICRHFHIPLQSADAGVLEKMGRPYSPAAFENLVAGIHRRMPEAAIGADVLVGFPGETRQAFDNTCAMVERLPLTYLHVFPFSPRPGTPAAGFGDRVPPAEIKARSRLMRQLGNEKRRHFYRAFVGQTLPVLVETKRHPGSGLLKGITDNYLPVLFQGEDSLFNTMVDVVVDEAGPDRLEGRATGRESTPVRERESP